MRMLFLFEFRLDGESLYITNVINYKLPLRRPTWFSVHSTVLYYSYVKVTIVRINLFDFEQNTSIFILL